MRRFNLAEAMGRTAAEPTEVAEADGTVYLTRKGVVGILIANDFDLHQVDAPEEVKNDFSLALMTADAYEINPAFVADRLADERQLFLSDKLLCVGIGAFYFAQQFMEETPPDAYY